MTFRPALWLVALAVVVADQASKQWSLHALADGQTRPLLGDYLSLQLVFNDGAAFSLGSGYTWVLTIITALLTVGIVHYARRAAPGWVTVLFGIGLGGAVGNLIDRLFRDPGFAQGHVVDMINYNGYFVGNVADIAIVGAACALVVASIFGSHILQADAADAPTANDEAVGAAAEDEADRG